MQVGVLGPLEVTVGGQRVNVGGPKERAVLAALALRAGETVSAAQLIEDLWGGDPPRSAGKTLQTYVSHLRRVLPNGSIVTAGAGYRLDVAPDSIDAGRFERLVTQGCTELVAGAVNEAVATLDEALAGWRGEPLAELDDLPVVAAEAVRLGELRLTAVEARVEAGLEMGDGSRLVGDLQRLVRAHPTRERLWGQLMLALYQCGRQADARCRPEQPIFQTTSTRCARGPNRRSVCSAWPMEQRRSPTSTTSSTANTDMPLGRGVGVRRSE